VDIRDKKEKKEIQVAKGPPELGFLFFKVGQIIKRK
jgi:hypothetical protein